MQWGSVKPEHWLILERRFSQGKPCKPLEERPSFYSDLRPVWNAFWTLHKARGYNATGIPCAILLSEIKAWIELFGVENRKELIRGIYVLDQEYLDIMIQRHMKEQSRMEKQAKRRTIGDGRNSKRRS